MDGCFNGFGKASIVTDKADSKQKNRVHNSARKGQPEVFMLLSYPCSHGGPKELFCRHH